MSTVRKPIGVFDSGIGGLTLVKALVEELPSESVVYFGDTARVPYGTKSKSTIVRFSLENVEFLLRFDVKCIVVACNTSSSWALPTLRKYFKVPIIGVIRPGAMAASRRTRNKKVGVIGTRATVESRAYETAIARIDPAIAVSSQSCPLFVPLVEAGWLNGSVCRLVTEQYLDPLKQQGIDTLILGCTHYPLLKPVLARQAPGIRLIDSAEETARETEDLLESLKLRRASGKGSSKFFVSDGPKRFLGFARRLLGPSVRSVAVRRID
jgi:glutamate racemase